MEKEFIGKFSAIRFDGDYYTFIVYDDNTIECPDLYLENIFRVIIKPRFILYAYDESAKSKKNISVYKSSAKSGEIGAMIKDFIIPDDLFDYLKMHNMISYSTDMAYLYNLKEKEGYDSNHNVHPYKRAEKKGPILVKQRSGIYN